MKERIGETYSSWPDVIAISDDGKWRIIVSHDTKPATQWIVQKRLSDLRWLARKFCQTKMGLELSVGDKSLLEVIKTLPDRCPQRPAKEGA